MCEVAEDCLCVGGILAGYEEADRLGRRLGATMAEATSIRMSSTTGTELTAQVTGRPVQYETGLFREPGQFGALPNSELNISPIEGTLASFEDWSAYNLAEPAVGLNPKSRTYATNQEDLGKLGFGHHGIGSSYAIGGDIKAPCHIDVIYSEATLELDGRVVLDKGRLAL